MKTVKDGYIRITDKVYFEYYELEKPMKKDYISNHYLITQVKYENAMKKYEASKRTIEVSNLDLYIDEETGEKVALFIASMEKSGIFKNGQPCKAEVNGTATIVKLSSICNHSLEYIDIGVMECTECGKIFNEK